MSTRPRGMNRSDYWRLPREYRRIHEVCCIGAPYTCPVCFQLDHECRDTCGCYARNSTAWRVAHDEWLKVHDPELYAETVTAFTESL